MDRLSRLKKPLDQMTPEEVHELIRHIRGDRRLTKEKPAEKRKAARSKDKDKSKLAELLKGMTPEEIAALLRDDGDAAD